MSGQCPYSRNVSISIQFWEATALAKKRDSASSARQTLHLQFEPLPIPAQIDS
jgi:hypothetical protein